jgi:hypothetical protein
MPLLRTLDGGGCLNFILNAAWEAPVKRHSHRLVLVRLADQARTNGLAWPSIENLSKVTLLSRRTVIRSIEALQESGYLEVLPRHKNEDGSRNNCYRVRLEKMCLSGATVTPQAACSSATVTLGDVSKTTQRSATVSKPPAPPYRKNRKEPTYEPDDSVVAEAIASIVDSEDELQGEPVRQSLAKTIDSELRSGAELWELVRTLLANWRKFSTARSQGKFEIRGWGPANFFAGGWWKREQDWPWKPEFRPERKMRYCDPATLYTGPEYQRRAEGA